jgi:hypothetical protein
LWDPRVEKPEFKQENPGRRFQRGKKLDRLVGLFWRPVLWEMSGVHPWPSGLHSEYTWIQQHELVLDP